MTPTTTTTVPGPRTVDLSQSWGKLWSSASASSGFSELRWVLTVVGTIIVAAAILRYIWDSRKGQGKRQHVIWSLVVGAILVLPGVLVPVLLTLADAVINLIIGASGK